MQTGCESCHKQTLKTGTSPISSLSNKTFHPYTDFLLHDMGPALDDGYTEGSAKTSEWRTPPLWGWVYRLIHKAGNTFYCMMEEQRVSKKQYSCMEAKVNKAKKGFSSFLYRKRIASLNF